MAAGRPLIEGAAARGVVVVTSTLTALPALPGPPKVAVELAAEVAAEDAIAKRPVVLGRTTADNLPEGRLAAGQMSEDCLPTKRHSTVKQQPARSISTLFGPRRYDAHSVNQHAHACTWSHVRKLNNKKIQDSQLMNL